METPVDYGDIYARRAEEYDELVRAEDCEDELLPALESIASLAHARVLEVGTGTGRITGLLLASGARVLGVDRHPAMLAVARRRLEQWLPSRCLLICGDALTLPVGQGWADVAIAGWVLGHLCSWRAATWREDIARALLEMERALRPGGMLIVIETLGTGTATPRPPNEELARYYGWLEEKQGMSRRWIRTDYQFPGRNEADRAMRFFFGRASAEHARLGDGSRIPECTGIWWRPRRAGDELS